MSNVPAHISRPGKRRVRKFIRRLVKKSGRSTVHRKTIPQRIYRYRYFFDIANTLITARWEWTLLVVSLVFLSTWIIFACLWMLIAKANGDLDADTETNKTTEPCLSGIRSFAGYLLFSIETQTSIGYGNRTINHHCPEAIFLMCVQIVMGICICGGLVTLVYTKMSSPHRLHSLNSFSKYAVICQRDGQLCMMFRVRDCIGRYQCHSRIRAYLVQKRKKGLFLRSLYLEPPGILIWPIEVIHIINKSSPFWDLSARDLIMKRFEIIISMEGESAATCCMSETIASYLNNEILWGHKFVNCIKYDVSKEHYVVDHRLFNSTQEVATPLCSAKRLAEVMEAVKEEFSNISDLNSFNTGMSDIRSNSTEPEVNSQQFDQDSGRGTLSPVIVHRETREDDFDDLEKRKASSESNSDNDQEYIMDDMKNEDTLGSDETNTLLKSLEKFIQNHKVPELSEEKGLLETSL